MCIPTDTDTETDMDNETYTDIHTGMSTTHIPHFSYTSNITAHTT